MRIAFVADPHSPNGWYRGIGPMVALAARGHEIRQLVRPGGVFRPQLLDGADLLHVHRHSDDETVALVRRAKAAGIPFVWDNDDDLGAVPRGNVAYREFGGARGARKLAVVRRLVQAADLVTTPSDHLAGVFAEYGAARVEVIENYVRDECLLVPQRKRDGKRVVVGWLAGKEHHLDAERLPIRAVLERLLERHPEVEVRSIGVGLGIASPRYRHVSEVRFDVLERTLAELDLGIAPLSDIPFNRARSNVKLKEYASVGVPWLASPIGPYIGLGEKEGGRLVADDGWDDALERLMTSPRERRKLTKLALKWGRGQTVCSNAAALEQQFGSLVERL